tara:strand:+ start:162 stop:1607 length:1446 start_codon:yes stop_codon:yes gene_type:complete
MSTQHPDNVITPFFADEKIIHGEDELKEAYYSYSLLKIKEQLWDFEGKDVDISVVRKLLTRYGDFFEQNKLGKDINLTYRIPNPEVEKNEGKVVLETLESIPRSFDVAKLFYNEEIAPVFEVAIPMVTNSLSLIRVAEYYKQFVSGKSQSRLLTGDQPISSWLGDFSPKTIRVIPLIEDQESILKAHQIVEEFITHQKIEDYQRVWLARSDPALNYGSLPTVLIEKIGLQNLHELSKKLSVDIHPILGCGSAPFRGNFRPTNVGDNLKAYPSVKTFTIQSAFKYDYDSQVVREAIEEIESTPTKRPIFVDTQVLLPIINKVGQAYQDQIKLIAGMVNAFSSHMPQRRKRKLHIGLFGYSRNSCGICLPRAIGFAGSLYSLGLPPDLLGLHVLNSKDLEIINHAYPTFENDFQDAAQLVNIDNLRLFPQQIAEQIKQALKLADYKINEKHQQLTREIMDDFRLKRDVNGKIEDAGRIRGYLG